MSDKFQIPREPLVPDMGLEFRDMTREELAELMRLTEMPEARPAHANHSNEGAGLSAIE